MAGRTPDISTSSFKPLSLDEIMMVPLAKQAQEDQATLALDELSKLEAQSLDVDKQYVAGQVDAFQNEASFISDQLMNQGVDRNLINKTKALRARKNKEFSIHGKTGQANAAFNQYQANKKSIMARGDLTAQQKKLGLAKAQSDYVGVVEGGQYQDYVGTAYQDVMKKGREIVKQMTPEQKAGALGMTIDENGMYRDGKYTYKRLKPEHIARVVKQALSGDKAVTDYINEIEMLDPSQSADKILSDAAISAGNVGQVDNYGESWDLLPASMQKPRIDSTQGMIDASQPWTVMRVYNQEGLWNRTFNLPSEDEAAKLFTDGNLSVELTLNDEEADAKIEKERAAFVAEAKKQGIPWRDLNQTLMVWDMHNKTNKEKTKEFYQLKESLDSLKENFPVLKGDNPDTNAPWTDKEIYDIYRNGAKLSEESYSNVVKPENPSSTFVQTGKDLLNRDGRNGSFVQKNMKVAGMAEGASKDVVAEKLDMDLIEFNTMVRETGQVLGFAPGHVDMPGAFAVQVEMEDGSTPIIYMQNDGKANDIMKSVSWMNDAVRSGKSYDLHQSRGRDGKLVNEHVITELNPTSKSYEAAIIRSNTEYTKEQIDAMTFVPNPKNPSIQVAIDESGVAIQPLVVKMMYDNEMQRATKLATDYYDAVPNSKQGLSKAQKN